MYDEPILEVNRLSPRRGMWPWREAKYAVYQRQPDGTSVEIFAGYYRHGQDALQAAWDFLNSERAVDDKSIEPAPESDIPPGAQSTV